MGRWRRLPSAHQGLAERRPARISSRPTATPATPDARVRSEAEFVDGGMQLVDTTVDAERAGPEELIRAVAAREDADAEHAGSTCRQEVPYRIAHHVQSRTATPSRS